MSERSLKDLQIVLDVSRIAVAQMSIEERAEALLEPLRRIVPFQGAWISLLDPDLGEQTPLVSYGYPAELVRYLGGPESVAEIERLGLNRAAMATRLVDLPVPLQEIRSWVEYLAPAGFRGGVAAGLFTGGGRYLGMLGLNTDSSAQPTRAASDLISALLPIIAQALDPMRALDAAAEVVQGASAGIVLTRAGHPLPLSGLPAHPLLDESSPVLAVAARLLTSGCGYAAFLCPSTTEALRSYLRITVIECAVHGAAHLAGVMVVSPPGETYDLASPEPEILGMLMEDWPLSRIAGALVLDSRVLAIHLASLQHKLGARTRDIAALRALRHGLYVPVALA